MKKIYISGGITGVENYEVNFKNAEIALEYAGFQPVNPVELKHDHDQSYGEFMKVDLKALIECDGILMLEGWESSPGAKIEKMVADFCGIEEVSI